MKLFGLQFAPLIVALLLASPLCGAYETDQLTNRLEPLEESMAAMDDKVNRSIEKAVSKWRGPRNDRKMVYKIYHDLGGLHWVDRIERWAWTSDEVDKLETPRFKSIYSGHPLWASRWVAPFGVGPTIKINGQMIGTDKLGHYFSQGMKFYLRYQKSQDVAKAAEQSAFTERALFGQPMTGSYSNADLVANYEGFRFYLSLFNDDVVPGKPAILRWQDDHWVIQRKFTWADHVNEYWDEALNINYYDGLLYPHMQERFETFCPDYFKAPEMYDIDKQQEKALKQRYEFLQLRDTSELRLSRICQPAGTDYPAAGVTAQPN